MTTLHANVFTRLRAEASMANPKPASTVSRVHADPRCCLEYRFDTGEKRSYLIAYCPSKSLPAASKWPVLKAFEIKQRSVGGQECLAVSVSPSLPSADVDFAEFLLSSVGIRCQNGLPPAEAVEDMLACLAKVQHLTKGRGQPLSADAQVGLFGELYVMDTILGATAGFARAIDEWVGPSGAPQDYQTQKCALEIKTTRGNLPQRIHISSARQLQSDTVKQLFLVRIAVDCQPKVGMSLPEIITKIEASIGASSLSALLFKEKLAEVGYIDEHAVQYEEAKYQVRSTTFYEVRQGFPRIQEKDLCPGVGEVKYDIEAGACSDFIVEEKAVRSALS